MYKITHQGLAQWGTHTPARRLSRCSPLNTMIASTQEDALWGEEWMSSLHSSIHVPTAPCGFPDELSSSPHVLGEAQPK